YDQLVAENRRRGKSDPEFELLDTGVFNGGRYFDVFAEYAKASPDDVLIRLTLANRGPEPASLHLLPTLWFRNTWSWACTHEGCEIKPYIKRLGDNGLSTWHASLDRFRFVAGPGPDGKSPPILLTENESNAHRLWGLGDPNPLAKDAFDEYVINKQTGIVA